MAPCMTKIGVAATKRKYEKMPQNCTVPDKAPAFVLADKMQAE
ncbi:hypothetical protein T4B_12423 [Trichinella pseudospiralis]|uniref:Uncharacterized protein n=1 Tax=Trichinella pseudospiralis TaxID=6337 RepID=A0A0V1GMN3_TRIPS|nr:hypothetical protein T4B_12423 [Trichinella pseudospiralis]KRY99487.1 hypothetical protein T4C_13428 [Trichinella pseudospiralis]